MFVVLLSDGVDGGRVWQLVLIVVIYLVEIVDEPAQHAVFVNVVDFVTVIENEAGLAKIFELCWGSLQGDERALKLLLVTLDVFLNVLTNGHLVPPEEEKDFFVVRRRIEDLV